MPELPEVEVTRRALEPYVVGKCISGCTLSWRTAVIAPNPERFAALVKGKKVREIRRRGKYLIFDLGGDLQLMLHLRMTGRLYFTSQAAPPTPYTRNSIQFVGGDELRFVDVRKLGQLWVAGPGVSDPPPRLPEGPEPLTAKFTPEVLEHNLAGRTTTIKAALLDQNTVAGLGNIYVDEALFEAMIHPERRCASLTGAEIARLHAAIVAVLQRGIENSGTSFRDFVGPTGERGANQDDLRVWHRAGQSCVRCQGRIVKTRVAGRGTHWCPVCQPLTVPE